MKREMKSNSRNKSQVTKYRENIHSLVCPAFSLTPDVDLCHAPFHKSLVVSNNCFNGTLLRLRNDPLDLVLFLLSISLLEDVCEHGVNMALLGFWIPAPVMGTVRVRGRVFKMDLYTGLTSSLWTSSQDSRFDGRSSFSLLKSSSSSAATFPDSTSVLWMYDTLSSSSPPSWPLECFLDGTQFCNMLPSYSVGAGHSASVSESWETSKAGIAELTWLHCSIVSLRYHVTYNCYSVFDVVYPSYLSAKSSYNVHCKVHFLSFTYILIKQFRLETVARNLR